MQSRTLISMILLSVLLGAGSSATSKASAGHPPALVPGSAPDSSSAGRPRIGLALSGGGARGLAHVGALKVIERLGIKVDYIAGTSMGAIVGGLYACGLSPGEIESEILGIDWEDLFSDRRKRSERTFRRKEDDGVEFFNIELGLEGIRPVMASGLIAGQKLALAFDIDEIYTTDRQDFDDLPIPFRAVATDIETGDMVVLGKGSLVHALRASMSIPGVFAPVHLGGRYLVDGGLVRNLPCDVVEQMGADVIIAVDVAGSVDPGDAGKIRSIADVSRQSFNIILRQTSREAVEKADVYIPMELEGVGIADFRDAADIISEGEEAASEYAAQLYRLASETAGAPGGTPARKSGKPAPVRIAKLRLGNFSRVSDREILRRISISPGDTLDRAKLSDDFLRLYELGIFESIDYRLIEEEGGVTLLIEVREKFYSPDILSLGVDYSDDLDGKSDFGALARYSRLEMNGFGGEIRADLRLGLSRGLRVEYYQPIEPSRTFFLAPRAAAVTSTRNIFDGDHKTAEFQTRYVGAGIDAGLQFGKFIEFRVGFELQRLNTVVDAGEALVPEQWKTRNSFVASMKSDFLDDPDFPGSGGSMSVRFRSATKRFGGEEEYRRLALDGAHFFSFGGLTVFGTMSGGTDFGDELPFDEMFTLGGAQSFAGLKEGQKSGGAFGVLRAGAYYRVRRGPLLVGPHFYTGGWLAAGNIWEGWDQVDESDVEYSMAVFVGMESIFGPVMIGYGRTTDGYDSAFLTAGRQFGSY